MSPGVTGGMPVRHAWSESDRFVPRAVVQPLQRLLDHEAAGAVVMLVAAAAAIVWANSPWSASHVELWATPLRVELGGLVALDHLSLQAWVNDALMTVFFLLVGLEIKRELVHGGLRDARAVALPVVAAAGGMVVPSAIYWAFNSGGAGADGWGIPMATDIAFAVGVVTLVGSRVPLGAKVFLLTLAIADDIGAIVVIAVFYTGDLWKQGLLLGGGVDQLISQVIGIVAITAWVSVTSFALFFLIMATIGLRVSEEEEIAGLDMEEHGAPGYGEGFGIFRPALPDSNGSPAPVATPELETIA